MKNLIKFLLFSLITSFHPAAYAVSGELGTWLRANAGPFVTLIEREPRFIGEPINIVALRDGRPVQPDSTLVRDISDELRRTLLRSQGIRVPLASDNCEFLPGGIVLGIEINRIDRTRHRVQLALIDLDENYWINQSTRVWTGRLSRDQYQRLASAPTSASVAYANNPDRAQDCHPEGHESNQPENPPAIEEPSGQPEVTAPAPRQTRFLSEISLSDKKVECKGHGKGCVDIEYEAFDDVYMFEFITLSGKLMALNCDANPELRYGATRQGLKIPTGSHPDRPSLGFYVLATRYPETASTISRFFGRQCLTTPDDRYLSELASLVARPDVEWRALHLVNRRGNVKPI